MSIAEKLERILLKSVLYTLPEEFAHNLVIAALKMGLFLPFSDIADKSLNIDILGKKFENPIGLAAGFDKNAECINSLSKMGFGFIECGTVTKNPQYGNKKPRMFRLNKDTAIINRMGFNNKGIDVFLKNLSHKNNKTIIGISLGVNKDTTTMIEDYIDLISKVNKISDYIVINISSPNTLILRELRNSKFMMQELLEKINVALKLENSNKGLSKNILLKISSDLSDSEKEKIAELIIKYSVSGIIVSNTSLIRDGLISKNRNQYGGLSGKPIFDISTRLLKDMYILTNKKIPIIASGGVVDSISAYKKIKNGASLVQLYTGIVYGGFSLVNKIKKDLIYFIKQDGFSSIVEAIGYDVSE